MSNIIRFRLNENPLPGKIVNFTIDVPGLITTNQFVEFVDGTPLFTTQISGETVQCSIGLTITETRENLKNWCISLITSISALTPYSNVVSYYDNYSNVVDINILYNVKFRIAFSPSRNPTNGQLFQIDIKKNGSIFKNLNKTFNNTVNSLTNIILGSNANLTLDNVLSNFNQYNSNPNISHSISDDTNIYGFKKLYFDIEDTANNNFTITTYTNNSGFSFEGPIKIPYNDIINEYSIGGQINALDLRVRSPYIYIRPIITGATCAIYVLNNTATQSNIFTYTDCATGQVVSKVVPASTSLYSTCAIEGTMNGPSFSIDTYCTGNAVDFSSIEYNIKSWKGDLSNQNSELIEYDKEKLKVVDIQDNVFINLSNLFRYKLEGDPINYINTPNPTQSNPISINESRWGYVSGDFKKNGINTNRDFSSTFYILDGYTEPNEAQGLDQRILMTNYNQREYGFNSIAKIHFKTEGLQSIQAYPGGSLTATPYTIYVSATPSLSYDYIHSIKVDTTKNMLYKFSYDQTYDTVLTSISDSSCKYDRCDILFKNKYGVIETLTFNKKSSRSLSTSTDDYLRGIVDYNGSVNYSRHTNKTFNTTSFTEVTLNTDFVPEYMNKIFTELMNSEEIWLLDSVNQGGSSVSRSYVGLPIPINRNDTQFSYKTHLNDKLIQYTMKFKYSHSKINNIL